jgi:hypothetical protein
MLVLLSWITLVVVVLPGAAKSMAMATVVATAPARSGAVGLAVAVEALLMAAGVSVAVTVLVAVALELCAMSLVGVCMTCAVGVGRDAPVLPLECLTADAASMATTTATNPLRILSSLA